MQLSIKEKIALNTIIEIGIDIFSCYYAISEGIDSDDEFKVLKALLDYEDFLYKSLHFNYDQYKQLYSDVSSKGNIENLARDIALKSLIMEDVGYHYSAFRFISRLRQESIRKKYSELGFLQCIEDELAEIRFSETLLGVRNKGFNKDSILQAYFDLMDSVDTERKAIDNALQPFDVYSDRIEIFSKMCEVKNCSKPDEKLEILSNYNNARNIAIEKEIKNKLMLAFSDMIKSLSNIEGSLLEDFNFANNYALFMSCISLYGVEERETLYAKLINFLPDNDEFYDLFEEAFTYAQKNIDTKVVRYFNKDKEVI